MLYGDGSFTAINTLNDYIMYGSSQHLNIHISFTRGTTWLYSITPALYQSCFIAPFVLCPSSPGTIYAGERGVFKSTTGGQYWTDTNGGLPLNGNPILSLAVAYDDPDRAYAATVPAGSKRAEVFKTTTGGDSWENITRDLPDRYYPDLQVSPHDNDVVYVTLSGFGSSHLYRTEDGGETWDDIGEGLPDIPTSAVIIDPEVPEHVYVGNDLGVYVSTDYGESWMAFQENLPTAVMVMDLSISPSDRKIRAVTHGNGVYERSLLTPTSVPDAGPPVITAFRLFPNYPNPFNPETRIAFALPKPSYVIVRVYNVLGQTIRTLTANGYPAGHHAVSWSGRDDAGNLVPGGTYIYKLQAGDFTETRKMVFVR